MTRRFRMSCCAEWAAPPEGPTVPLNAWAEPQGVEINVEIGHGCFGDAVVSVAWGGLERGS
jgi:hypothetical protein